MKLKANEAEQGFSLFEILIAIAVFGVVGVTAAQLISVSLMADKSSSQKTVAVGIAQETMAAINSVITEKWNNIYNLNKGSGNKYYPDNTAALCGSVKWCLIAGTASSTVNNLIYRRDLYIENICRDTSTKNITGITDSGGTSTTTCAVSGGTHDPSTQKITVTVLWEDSGGAQLGSITLSNHFTRSRNAAATQTGWDDTGGGSAPTSGENGAFGTGVTSLDAANISTTTPSGSITLKSQ